MINGDSILVSLVRVVDALPFLSPTTRRKRGRQPTYSDQLIVKALVVMIIRRWYTAWALRAFLPQDDPVVQPLRLLLTEYGRCPTCRTWEQCLAALPPTLPGLIGQLGRHWVTVLNPGEQRVQPKFPQRLRLRPLGGRVGWGLKRRLPQRAAAPVFSRTLAVHAGN